MDTVVVIGELTAVQGFGLAGAVVRVAGDTEAVRSAWRTLPADAAVVVLTREAAAALDEPAPAWPMVVVLP